MCVRWAPIPLRAAVADPLKPHPPQTPGHRRAARRVVLDDLACQDERLAKTQRPNELTDRRARCRDDEKPPVAPRGQGSAAQTL